MAKLLAIGGSAGELKNDPKLEGGQSGMAMTTTTTTMKTKQKMESVTPGQKLRFSGLKNLQGRPRNQGKKRGSSIPGSIRTSMDCFVQTISKCFLRQTVQLTELLCSVSSEFSTDPREKAIKVFNCWGWTNENKIETSSSSSSHLKTHITLKPF